MNLKHIKEFDVKAEFAKWKANAEEVTRVRQKLTLGGNYNVYTYNH